MARYLSHAFPNGSDITIDGNEFFACTFGDCVMHYHGGPIVMTNPVFNGLVQFQFHDSALRTLALLSHIQTAPGGEQCVLEMIAKSVAGGAVN